MKSWLSLLLALMAPVALFAESEDGKAKADTKKPDAKTKTKTKAKAKPGDKGGDKTASTEDERINAMLAELPANQVFHGISIPDYTMGGKLKSLFSAETAKRTANREIEMDGLKIEIHNDDGTTFHVEMAHSVFNFDTKILTSDTPTTIKRDDMVINGDRAQFHLKSRFGRVMGNVKMTIFSTGDISSDSDKPKKKKKDKSSGNTPQPTSKPNPQ